MKYLIIAFLLLFFLFVPQSVHAQDQKRYELTGNFIYDLTDPHTVKVREEVKVRNLTTEHYVPSFVFDVAGFHPQGVAVYENGLAAKINTLSETQYEVVFKKPALGRGANKTVAITFTDPTLMVKQGDVTEFHIPRIQNDAQFSSLTVVVRVPKEQSAQFHMFPQVSGVEKAQYIEYSLTTDLVRSQTITAFIGDVAAYDFTLNYPFTNSSYFNRQVTFAVPPDTAYQKISIHEFSEQPESLTYDSDGNWIGTLSLKPRESKSFVVKGTAFVYAQPRPDFPTSSEESVALNKKSEIYWESDASDVHSLAQELKTPKAIYDYVVANLSYDYTKTSRPQERLGAKAALQRKNEAICMEFTDLFIAIARAAGIPAREVNGFAISSDNIKPRSLGSNILHSWPEYWDGNLKRWIPIDPTWGNTTGGVDYFSHFDLNHISFVVHGRSSTEPQTPGTYAVGSEEPELITVTPSVSGQSEEPTAPVIESGFAKLGLWQMSYLVTIHNASGRALYDVPLLLESDGVIYNKQRIVSILPYSSYTVETPLLTGFFGTKLPANLKIRVLDTNKTVSVEKAPLLVLHFLVLLLPFILIPVVALYYFKNHAKH